MTDHTAHDEHVDDTDTSAFRESLARAFALAFLSVVSQTSYRSVEKSYGQQPIGPYWLAMAQHVYEDQQSGLIYAQDLTEATTWVVWSFEHDAWWAPGGRGHVPALVDAGGFSETTARRIEEDANIVTENERALPLAVAIRDGIPTRRTDARTR